MKNSKRALLCIRSGGFTLVELLVVIAIIAILAGVVLGGAGLAINAAKRIQAGNTATQIQTAIYNYNTEYGVYPLPANSPAGDVLYTTQAQEQPLIFALCGNVNAYAPTTPSVGTVANVRDIAFLSPKKSELDPEGVPITPFSSGTTYYYYSIAMDGDYTGILGDSGTAQAAIPDFTPANWPNGTTSSKKVELTQGVAIWACCDPKTLSNPATSTSPNLWVHTY